MKLKGLRSAFYRAANLQEAKAWYSTVFDIRPYFDEPFYVGFDIGGFELGLQPSSDTPPLGGNAYWGVDDADRMAAHLIEHGATEIDPVQEVGEGIRLGSVRDPFGNNIGLIYNPHFRYKE